MQLKTTGRIHQHQEGDDASELESLLYADPPPVIVEDDWTAQHRQAKLEERERWLARGDVVRDLLDGGVMGVDPPPPIVLRDD